MLKQVLLVLIFTGYSVNLLAKYCPQNKSFLDETYKAKSVVVTDSEGHQIILDLLEEYFRIKKNTHDAPTFILFVDESSIQIIKSFLQNKFPNSYEAIMSKIKFNNKVKLGYFNWQQDFLHIEFDSKTGLPVFRFANEYFDDSINHEDIQSYINAIDPKIKIGNGFNRAEDFFASEGGNIESGPQNTCAFGYREQPSNISFAKQFCDDHSIITLDVGFTANHHIDELMVNLPNLNREKKECEDAILINSTSKAMRNLKDNPDEYFFDQNFSIKSEKQFWNLRTFSDYVNLNEPLADICNSWTTSAVSNKLDDQKIKPLTIDEMKKIWKVKSNYPMTVRADEDGVINSKKLNNGELVDWYNEWFFDFFNYKNYNFCFSIKNKDVLSILKNKINGKSLLDVNLNIQKIISDNIAKLKNRVSHKCDLKVIETPAIYWRDLTTNNSATSTISPNVVNGISLNEIYASPNTPIKYFKKSLETELLTLGQQTIFVNTLRQSVLNGEIHCSSQVIRDCKPR